MKKHITCIRIVLILIAAGFIIVGTLTYTSILSAILFFTAFILICMFLFLQARDGA